MTKTDDSLKTPGKVIAYWRTLPEMQEFLRSCYYDDVQLAAERFLHSEEFSEVQRLVFSYTDSRSGRLLDIGGGNGMASIAWQRSGYQVVLLEPDDDLFVGYGALKELVAQDRTQVRICHAFGQDTPFADATFDVVYVRQVLHHIPDLPLIMREIHRVLKPKGVFIATREHVISKPEDLKAFHANHPMHQHTGGEHAYLLPEYTDAIKQAGLVLEKTLGHWSSVINYSPRSQAEFVENLEIKLSRIGGSWVAGRIVHTPALRSLLQGYLSWRDSTPGRLYTFVARRP